MVEGSRTRARPNMIWIHSRRETTALSLHELSREQRSVIHKITKGQGQPDEEKELYESNVYVMEWAFVII